MPLPSESAGAGEALQCVVAPPRKQSPCALALIADRRLPSSSRASQWRQSINAQRRATLSSVVDVLMLLHNLNVKKFLAITFRLCFHHKVSPSS